MSQKDSHQSNSIKRAKTTKNQSRDSFDAVPPWHHRRKLRRDKMTDSQIIENTLIANPTSSTHSQRKRQNLSKFHGYSKDSLQDERDNYYISQENDGPRRKTKKSEFSHMRMSKDSEEPEINYVSGYDSKGGYLVNFQSKSSRLTGGHNNDPPNRHNKNSKQKSSRIPKPRPPWRNLDSDDPPEETPENRPYNATSPNLRFKHRNDKYDSPNFDYNSPGRFNPNPANRMSSDMILEEARQIYGKMPKGMDPDSRPLKMTSPHTAHYPLSRINPKQRRIVSSSPINHLQRNRAERMKKKWIEPKVQKAKPLGYGQIDRKNEQFKKKTDKNTRKRTKAEGLEKKKRAKQGFGSYGKSPYTPYKGVSSKLNFHPIY